MIDWTDNEGHVWLWRSR